MRDNAFRKAQLAHNAQLSRTRNQARSVNTQRAMDLMGYMGMNQANRDIQDSFSQQMMQLKSQQAQLENVQDQYVMQGEYLRDLADRQDKAAYYQNLADNFVNAANALQSAGINVNQTKLNQDMMSLLPQLSEYGLGIRNTKEGYEVYSTKG